MGDSFINHLANGAAPPTNPLHPEEFRRQGHIIIDFLADYYQSIESYPVRSQMEPGYLRQRLPAAAPHAGEPIKAILEDITKHIIPGLTHWQSPNYFAYFPSSGSTAGFLGEMLSSGFNVVGFNWISSPAATELESIVMDWLGQTLKLPRAFLFSGGGGGVIQGTTCEAIVCTMIAAREKVLEKIGREKLGRLVVYSSDQTHCSVKKAAKITGISLENYRVIPTTAVDNFALSPTSLRTAIAADVAEGLVPFFLCATVGTTSSTAVDPIEKLCEVANEYKMWVHVDAAYGGSACILPELRHLIDGVELASSFSLNAHKWLFTNLDCCCLWVKDPRALIAALSTDDAEYLKNAASETGKVVDYKDWQLVLSRRFRALKLWLVLRSYGVAGLRGFLRSHVRLAQRFENLVAMDARFELVVPRTFALVCFRLLPAGTTSGNELSRMLLDAVNSSGRVCMSHAVVGGVYILRFAVGATLTEEQHVDAAWKVVQEHASTILTALNAHHTL